MPKMRSLERPAPETEVLFTKNLIRKTLSSITQPQTMKKSIAVYPTEAIQRSSVVFQENLSNISPLGLRIKSPSLPTVPFPSACQQHQLKRLHQQEPNCHHMLAPMPRLRTSPSASSWIHALFHQGRFAAQSAELLGKDKLWTIFQAT